MRVTCYHVSMTDKEKMDLIMALIPDVRSLATAAHDLLGVAQNGPPDGAADGTINSDDWHLLRNVSNALAAIVALK